MTETTDHVTDLAGLTEENPNPVLRISQEYYLQYANKASVLLLDTWACRVGGSVPADVRGMVRRALDTGETNTCEVRCGATVYALIFSPAASRKYVNVYVSDVSESRRAAEKLKERAHMLSLTPVFVWTDDSGVIFWSKGLENLYGWTREEALGRDSHQLLQTQFPQPREKIMAALRRDNQWAGELTHIKKNGEPIVVASHWVVQKQFDGHAAAVVQTDSDITDRKKAEEVLRRDKSTFEKLVRERTRELLRAEIELENSKRLSDIGTLSATVAHELRNPLGVIRTAVYNIRRKSQNPALESHIVNIEKKILESDQIINNLLGYSRIKMPQAEKVKLYFILDECIEFARERFEKTNLVIHKMLEPIKDVYVSVDPFQIREVFNNILDNACHAIAAAGGKVDISAANDRPNVITIRFKDNGSGIDPADLGKVFEPFFTRKSKGTGLGLTICREMVHLNGGEITVASKLGKGTTFHVTLPKSQ